MRMRVSPKQYQRMEGERKDIDCEMELVKAGVLKKRDRSPEQLRRGWRKFNRENHPDRGGDRDYWFKIKECKEWFEKNPDEEEPPFDDCEKKLMQHGIIASGTDTSLKMLRKGWRKFALRHHPDKVGQVTQLWHEIKECKEWFERVLQGEPGYSCVHKKCVVRRGGQFETLKQCETACGRDLAPFNEEEKKRREEERKRREEERKRREEERKERERRREEIRRDRKIEPTPHREDPFKKFRYSTPTVRDR